MSLKDQRMDGKPVAVKSAMVPFSLFQRDYAGQNFVPLQEPWSYAEFHIKNSYPSDRLRNALAYLQQAKSFYMAAAEADSHASPLLWYYCFLNLAKAHLVRTDPVEELASGMHGIGDPVENKEGYVTVGKQTIKTHGGPFSGTRYQIFPNLCRSIGEPLPPGEQLLSIKSLLRRVVGIHRAYMKAFGEDSHFFKLREPEFFECPPPNGPHLWLRFFLRDEDFNLTVPFETLAGNMQATFTAVTPGAIGASLKCQCFESKHIAFTKTAVEDLPLLINDIRPKIHPLILPRGYLYYVAYEPELPLAQAAVIYAIMFYLGSIVRYRPYDFDKLVEKKYRWVIDEFMQVAPKQFVVQMVNQITQSEISYFSGG